MFLLVATWLATVPNAYTVQLFHESRSAGEGLGALFFAFGGWLFLVTASLFLLVVLGLFFWGRGAKLLCMAVVLAAAPLSFFSTFLGTRFDKTMLVNIVQTNPGESLELLNARLVAWVLVVGVLPAILLWRWPLRPNEGRITSALRPVLALMVLVVITTGVVYAQYARYATAIRNRDVTFHTVAPGNILAAAISVGVMEFAANTVRAPRGTDAHQDYAIAKPRLLIFVLGETARAQNHGLNGYLRDTTPRMRASRGYYFPDTESCGTATAISVPCIFSGFTRHEFSLLRGRENETLIDVVVRSKARVLWLDNDSGCKGVCDKADFVDYTGSSNPRWCPEPGECHDEILLDGLEAKIRAEKRDTLVVLHLKGSHGPAYYKRYPPAFERFVPACRSNDLASCDRASLRNAYDNTILYTDHVVGESVQLLERLGDQFATALLYVSDHGESLGENGLYLHGMPFAVAPKEQTHVPMFSWVSPQFIRLERWNAACMLGQTKVPRTHDNVYATVLGFMEIESVEYKRELDLFEPCDPPSTPHRAR
ncbi:Phosphoethanolamine transferase EptA [Usitatibacter palustris]|uniref:Phosphoethanolamine transferase EptA n=1 Tax=Usitatibacter palustris TaxID=2732487 RepID=A0A6M4H4T1_9PROT|nr:Phosphoethanolamine transferase EptA [Usitatibacter palustris]